jgi:CBS domain-containing protein
VQVEQFLKKYGGPVFTVSPDMRIAECARRFAGQTGGKRYTVAVVSDADDRVAGIVSVDDLIDALGRHEDKAAGMSVAEIMTKEVYTCQSHDVLENVLKDMAARRLRHCPVVSDGKLAGLVIRTGKSGGRGVSAAPGR